MQSQVPLLIMPVALPLLVVLTRMSVARFRSSGDIRANLDPLTARWLSSRDHRTRASGDGHRDNCIAWTTHLEAPPVGATRTLVAFDACSPGRVVTYVGAAAPCGPVEFVAMPRVPDAVLRRFEPGFVPLDRDRCPSGWSLALAPGTADALPDPVVTEALEALEPRSPEVWTADEDLRVSTLVHRHRSSLRIHFTPQRLYVIGGNGADRRDLMRIAEALAARLDQRPSGAWCDRIRPAVGPPVVASAGAVPALTSLPPLSTAAPSSTS